MAWYHTLAHPPLVPPDAVFGMMWGILYILLGISAVLVFHRGVDESRQFAAWLLGVQLLLNACWTPVFFGAHSLTGGLILIVAMFVEFIFLLCAFWKINTASAWLLMPYGAWLLFATYLTAGTWAMN